MKFLIKTVLAITTILFLTTITSKPAHVTASNSSAAKVIGIAKSKLGASYAYGATGPNRFDCSGFSGYVYKKAVHKVLPRTASAQYTSAKKVSASKVKPGDLVFFGSSKRNIWHVGICVGGGKMIDAQNRGVITEKIKVPWWHAVGYSRPANLH